MARHDGGDIACGVMAAQWLETTETSRASALRRGFGKKRALRDPNCPTP
jgi:hypothetical protein